MHDKILILDFGSQVTQLIARRVRDARVYSEIHPYDCDPEFIRKFIQEQGGKGISLIMAEVDGLDGFRRGKLLDKVGQHTIDTAELFFDDMRVPVSNLLGTEEGRGFVQLTHRDNYERMSRVVGLDLVAEPDLAMKPDAAASILICGMQEGLFTGARLLDFFSGQKADWTGARKIVNGRDRAAKIAVTARTFDAAIRAGLMV